MTLASGMTPKPSGASPQSTRTPVPTGYPKRDPYFAHRFVRLLSMCGAAQDIGPEGAWLLSVIAHQEDAIRYSRPVTFYNGQLMALCGFESENRLNRCRKRVVDAGWLHYTHALKRRPGVYWVIVPPGVASHSNYFPSVLEGNPYPQGTSPTECPSILEGKEEFPPVFPSVFPSILEPQTEALHPSSLLPFNPKDKETPLPPKGERRGSSNLSFDGRKAEIPERLNTPAFREAWELYCTHLTEKRARMTPTSTKEQLAKLSEIGEQRAIAAIKHSVAQGWKSIIEPSESRSGKTGSQVSEWQAERDRRKADRDKRLGLSTIGEALGKSAINNPGGK
ncbi:MAG: hypothetical protein IT428_06755 [Planctomycetaceae bacterium]|nr:hypothetical protein [Planctomycetaceae bacterium]